MENEQLITEITYLAMMVNFKTDYCTFVTFSGHVDKFTVSIRESKDNYRDHVADSEFSFKRNDIEKLKQTKETLIEILESGEVDTSNMNYSIEEVKHYHF